MSGSSWLVAATWLVAASAASAQWSYKALADPMNGGQTNTAAVESQDSLKLAFPYSGKNHGRFIVRQHPRHGLDVIFQVDKGQLMCRVSGCSLLVKFDDGKPIAFAAVGADDNASNVIFLTNSKRFVESARKASRILAQPTLFQNGSQVLTFETPGGLYWK